jgi:hypothetical protein
MKVDTKGFKVLWIFCLNIGEPSSKPKYSVQAIVNSTVREKLN